MSTYEPKHSYAPLPGLNVNLFPPRIRGAEGVSLSTMQADGNGLAWKSVLGGVNLTCTIRGEPHHLDIFLVLRNDGREAREVSIRYPRVHYTFPHSARVRVFDPVFGGVLEPKTLWQNSSYPGYASFCLAMATGDNQAIALAVLNEQQRHARISHVPGHTHGQIEIELPNVLVRPGQTLELPAAYVAVGAHWGEVLRPYRDWLLKTFPSHVELPAWYEENRFMNVWAAHCVAPNHPPPTAPGVWIFDSGFKRRTWDELKTEIDKGFEQAAAAGARPLFYQFGWWKQMATHLGLEPFDAVSGDYLDAHDLARRGVEYIHSRGGRTFLYTNFISAGGETDVFRLRPQLFARDDGGLAFRNADYAQFLFCPGAPGIREYWDQVLNYILKEMDADGIFLDQVGGGTAPARCRDPRHRHEDPDSYGRDYLALLDHVRRRAPQLKSDALICGELPSDVRSMWIDQVHGQGYNRATPMTFASPDDAATTPPHEYLAFHNFINPHAALLPAEPELVAVGVPGRPDNALYRRFRDIFRAGLQPCPADPCGAMAYLFGPAKGEAILATRAWADLGEVHVTLPMPMRPAEGGSHVARAAGAATLVVEASSAPRFYRLTAM